MSKQPVNLDERRAARRRDMPKVLSPEQLRRRALTKLRHNLSHLADEMFDEAKEWLQLIAVTDGPKAAFDSYLKLLEFAVPKLSRAEVAVETGDKGSVAEFSIEDLQALIAEGAAAQAAQNQNSSGENSDVTHSGESD